MRALGILCLLFVSSVAHASWDPPGKAPTIPVMTDGYRQQFPYATILDGYQWGSAQSPPSDTPERDMRNGQWADLYFPIGTIVPGVRALPTTLPASINCVFMYYHGGSWNGGTPRTDSFFSLAKYVVSNLHCLLISTSYPLSDYDHTPDTGGALIPSDVNIGIYQRGTVSVYGNSYMTALSPINLKMIVGDDLLWGFRYGSVLQTFDYFYYNFYATWKANNPNLTLWVSGGSAGAYLAQRVAEDGRWPVQYSLVMGLPVVNPGSQTPGARSVLEDRPVSASDPSLDSHSCFYRFSGRETDCNYFRNVYGEYQGQRNSLDLQLYHGRNSALVKTFVVANVCDEAAELGAALLGWFNSLPGDKYLKIHDDCPGNLSGHACLDTIINDFILSLDPANNATPDTGIWQFNGIWRFGSVPNKLTLPSYPGATAATPYSPYCPTSSPSFSKIIN